MILIHMVKSSAMQIIKNQTPHEDAHEESETISEQEPYDKGKTFSPIQ